MPEIEEKIKEFSRSQGVMIAGIAGPERLNGPPSVNLNYSMKGAKSFVSLVLPMDPEAIYEFLSKKSPAPHNLDQYRSYQRLLRIGQNVADYISTLGFSAKALPLSADYRRALYVFNPRPAFSLRLGAIAAGTAGCGWSGNVMTKEYGAAVYLGGVATNAELRSDPLIPARYFLDNFCAKCRRCARACPSGMFDAKEEENFLLNGSLYQRAKRRNIDLCHTSCFGLHSISANKNFSNWGLHWIEKWTRSMPDPAARYRLRLSMFRRGLTTGDSEPRFDVLRRLCYMLWPEKIFDGIPGLKDFPSDEAERMAILAELVRRTGIKGIDQYPISVMCGHCAIMCADNLEETSKRYNMLIKSGIAVPGPGGKMITAGTFDEARKIREKHPLKISRSRILSDAAKKIWLWHRHYFGLEPKSLLQAAVYRYRLKRAIKAKNFIDF